MDPITKEAFCLELIKLSRHEAHEVGSLEEMKKHLEPGDIFLVTNAAAPPGSSDAFRMLNSVFDRGSSAVQKSPYTHSAGYIGDGKLVETAPGYGPRVKSIEEALEGRNVHVVRPHAPRHERHTAAKRMLDLATQELSNPTAEAPTYDMPGLVQTAASRILGVPLVDQQARMEKNKYICSSVIAHGYHKRNFAPENSPGGILVPGDFYNSKHVKHVANWAPLGEGKDRPFMLDRNTVAEAAARADKAKAQHEAEIAALAQQHLARTASAAMPKVATQGYGAPPQQYEEMNKAKWKQMAMDVPVAIGGTALGYGVGLTGMQYLAPKLLRGVTPEVQAQLLSHVPLAAAAAGGLSSYLLMAQYRAMERRRAQAAEEAQARAQQQ